MLDVSSPHDAYPSRLNFGDGDYFLTREAIDAATQNYLKDDALVHDPRVSPIRAPSLAGAPPAYILVGACDPLRDEARAYAAPFTHSCHSAYSAHRNVRKPVL